MTERYDKKSMIGNWIMKSDVKEMPYFNQSPPTKLVFECLAKCLDRNLAPVFKTCYEVCTLEPSRDFFKKV